MTLPSLCLGPRGAMPDCLNGQTNVVVETGDRLPRMGAKMNLDIIHDFIRRESAKLSWILLNPSWIWPKTTPIRIEVFWVSWAPKDAVQSQKVLWDEISDQVSLQKSRKETRSLNSLSQCTEINVYQSQAASTKSVLIVSTESTQRVSFNDAVSFFTHLLNTVVSGIPQTWFTPQWLVWWPDERNHVQNAFARLKNRMKAIWRTIWGILEFRKEKHFWIASKAARGFDKTTFEFRGS